MTAPRATITPEAVVMNLVAIACAIGAIWTGDKDAARLAVIICVLSLLAARIEKAIAGWSRQP